MKNVFNILNAKYKNVKLTEDEISTPPFKELTISIEPFKESDVMFFLCNDGIAGWVQYVNSDDFKPVSKEFPPQGTSDADLLRAMENAIAEYKKEQQEFFDACTDALVEWNGWTREYAIDSQINSEHLFTREWMRELDIK